jgi:hypothetical protein
MFKNGWLVFIFWEVMKGPFHHRLTSGHLHFVFLKVFGKSVPCLFQSTDQQTLA